MSDFGDYSGDEYDQDWLYVEEHYDEADDLAEHTCPSPVYQCNIEEDFGEYDPYDYWEDLSYLSDSYHDGNIKGIPEKGDQKRKSITTEAQSRPAKKRRRNPQDKEVHDDSDPVGSRVSQFSPVLWITNRERQLIAQREAIPVTRGPGKAFALLKDWKERFKNSPGFDTSLDGDEPGEGGPVADVDIDGDGFDLDISSIAKILSNSDSMDELRSMMEAQGFDSKIIDAAMKDLSEGRDYQEEAEDNDDDADETGDLDHTDEISGGVNMDAGYRPSPLSSVIDSGGGGGGGEYRVSQSLSNGSFAQASKDLSSPKILSGRFKLDSNASSPTHTSPSKKGMRTAPGKGFKRARGASPPDEEEEEQMAKRTRRKKVSYAGMT